jgi:hypothetical protein
MKIGLIGLVVCRVTIMPASKQILPETDSPATKTGVDHGFKSL